MKNLVPQEQLDNLIEEAKKANVERFVVGILIDKGNPTRVLVVKRAPGETFLPNVDEIPGGGVDPGETLPDTIVRETFEETGLKVTKILQYMSQFDYLSSKGQLTRQFNFLVEVNDGNELADEDIKLNPKEHSSFKWVGVEGVDDLIANGYAMKKCIWDYLVQ